MTNLIQLTFSETEANVVLSALAQQPYAQVVNLISNIMDQVQKQKQDLTPEV